jgi:hypothetical protein
VQYAEDGHSGRSVIYLVENAPVSHPNAPGSRPATAQQPAPRWARVLAKPTKRGEHALGHVIGEPVKIVICR